VKAELVKLRYFAGLTLKEGAEVLGISPNYRRPLLSLRAGRAIGYARSNRSALNRWLDAGSLVVDNSAAGTDREHALSDIDPS
jgi:hypothetical protein